MELKQSYEVDKDAHYKPKKYVFKIYPENIDHVEPLSIKQREELINEAIQTYVHNYGVGQKKEEFVDQVKKFALYAIVVLLTLPILVYFIKSFTTNSNVTTKQMEYNFERLFDNYKRR